MPFAINIVIAVAVTITITVAIADAVITISPLFSPLCLLIVVSSSKQRHHYQWWRCCRCHSCYIDSSINVVAMAAQDNGSSSSSLNRQIMSCTTVDATNHNDCNQAMAVTAYESTFFLPFLSA
jgi:hypothetical protein